MNTNHLHQLVHATLKGLLLVGLASSPLLPTASGAETPEADGRVYLTPDMAVEVENFLEVQTNLSFRGEPISVGKHQLENGLGVHAPSRIVFPLDRNYKTFHVIPGPDDGQFGLLEMKILVDDTEVWSSGQVKSPKFVAEPLEFPVAGAQNLTLIVDECGDNGGDHANWGDAYLIPNSNP